MATIPVPSSKITVHKVYSVRVDGLTVVLTLEQMRDLMKVFGTILEQEFENSDIVVTQWDNTEA